MPNERQKWNQEVTEAVAKLDPVKKWLTPKIDAKSLDWGSQKAAHQALRFLELAEYEMLHLQYWENDKQKQLHEKAQRDVAT